MNPLRPGLWREPAKRTWTTPIPDDLLALVVATGMVVVDKDSEAAFFRASVHVGGLWGPAIEGHWFAFVTGVDPVRVETRDDAVRHVLTGKVAAS